LEPSGSVTMGMEVPKVALFGVARVSTFGQTCLQNEVRFSV
jgi:hypothetical protein